MLKTFSNFFTLDHDMVQFHVLRSIKKLSAFVFDLLELIRGYFLLLGLLFSKLDELLKVQDSVFKALISKV